MAAPLWLFSTTDVSIDIVGTIFFAAVILQSVKYLWMNNITIAGKIIYGFLVVISSLHIFQVIFQTLTFGPAPFRIWDFINYLTGILFLMIAHRTIIREKNCHE